MKTLVSVSQKSLLVGLGMVIIGLVSCTSQSHWASQNSGGPYDDLYAAGNRSMRNPSASTGQTQAVATAPTRPTSDGGTGNGGYDYYQRPSTGGYSPNGGVTVTNQASNPQNSYQPATTSPQDTVAEYYRPSQVSSSGYQGTRLYQTGYTAGNSVSPSASGGGTVINNNYYGDYYDSFNNNAGWNNGFNNGWGGGWNNGWYRPTIGYFSPCWSPWGGGFGWGIGNTWRLGGGTFIGIGIGTGWGRPWGWNSPWYDPYWGYSPWGGGWGPGLGWGGGFGWGSPWGWGYNPYGWGFNPWYANNGGWSGNNGNGGNDNGNANRNRGSFGTGPIGTGQGSGQAGDRGSVTLPPSNGRVDAGAGSGRNASGAISGGRGASGTVEPSTPARVIDINQPGGRTAVDITKTDRGIEVRTPETPVMTDPSRATGGGSEYYGGRGAAVPNTNPVPTPGNSTPPAGFDRGGALRDVPPAYRNNTSPSDYRVGGREAIQPTSPNPYGDMGSRGARVDDYSPNSGINYYDNGRSSGRGGNWSGGGGRDVSGGGVTPSSGDRGSRSWGGSDIDRGSRGWGGSGSSGSSSGSNSGGSWGGRNSSGSSWGGGGGGRTFSSPSPSSGGGGGRSFGGGGGGGGGGRSFGGGGGGRR